MGFFRLPTWPENDSEMEDTGTPPPFRRADVNYDYAPPQQSPPHLTNQTYVSLGLFASIITATVWLTNTINSGKTEQMQTRNELSTRLDKQDNRLDLFASQLNLVSSQVKDAQQANRETWGFHDMLMWSVHFQRDNPNVKVPEPIPPK